jgi:NADPH:quinone reductase-like Zn-dependent oxidoreductase
MRVATTVSFGPPSVLKLAESPSPDIGTHDLRVRVVTASVTAADRRLRTADYPGISAIFGRLLFGITSPRYPVQGTNFAGEVFGGTNHGAYAEYLVAAEDGPLAKIPNGVSHEAAATLPYGAATAVTFLRDIAAVQPGESVLILGASGGVGRYAVQVAKHLGADVTAVCSRPQFDLMRDLGADKVIDHRSEDFTANGQQYDVIFDIADASSFRHSRGSLTDSGRYMTLYISIRVLLQMAWTKLAGGKRALFSVAIGSSASAIELGDMLSDGVFKPVVTERFSFDEVAEAHALSDRGVHGDVIVKVGQA